VGRDLGRDMSSTPRMHAGRSGGGRGSGGGSVSNGAHAVGESFFERRDFLSLEVRILKSTLYSAFYVLTFLYHSHDFLSLEARILKSTLYSNFVSFSFFFERRKFYLWRHSFSKVP